MAGRDEQPSRSRFTDIWGQQSWHRVRNLK
jgi:hypothetical protein